MVYNVLNQHQKTADKVLAARAHARTSSLLPALMILLVSFSTPICSAEMRDPTKPAYFVKPGRIVKQHGLNLTLSAVWLSKHSRRATINGITARQGQTILSTIKILKINKNSVIILNNGVRRKLYLNARQANSRKIRAIPR